MASTFSQAVRCASLQSRLGTPHAASSRSRKFAQLAHTRSFFSTVYARQSLESTIKESGVASPPFDVATVKPIELDQDEPSRAESTTSRIPTFEQNPRWILPISERPKRRLTSKRTGRKIKIFAPPRSARKQCPEPLKTVNEQEIAKLDPTGARTRLFSLANPDAIQVRDIVLVRQKTGDPFAGVLIRIKRAGPNTGILLRNTIAGTGVEMDLKIYSPAVTGIELVQRRPKKPQQHRLYYLRHPKHDVGSVDNIVRQYLRTKSNTVAGKTVLKADPKTPGKQQKKKR